MLSITQRCELKDIPGVLISVSFERAFDTLDWVYIDKTLIFFNIPDTTQKWLKILYNGVGPHGTSNYGSSTRMSTLTISFYNCSLNITIRQNNDIQEIQIGNKDFNIRQYAYDTVFCVRTSVYQENCQSLKKISAISGLQIIYTKTEVLRGTTFREISIKHFHSGKCVCKCPMRNVSA